MGLRNDLHTSDRSRIGDKPLMNIIFLHSWITHSTILDSSSASGTASSLVASFFHDDDVADVYYSNFSSYIYLSFACLDPIYPGLSVTLLLFISSSISSSSFIHSSFESFFTFESLPIFCTINLRAVPSVLHGQVPVRLFHIYDFMDLRISCFCKAYL